MVRHRVQVVAVRGYLRSGIIGRVRLRACAIDAGWERRGHIVCQVQALQREINVLLDLVRERALEREAFQVDEQHGWESRKGECLGRFAQRFASWAVPMYFVKRGV
jgi:hypothetical protein